MKNFIILFFQLYYFFSIIYYDSQLFRNNLLIKLKFFTLRWTQGEKEMNYKY